MTPDPSPFVRKNANVSQEEGLLPLSLSAPAPLTPPQSFSQERYRLAELINAIVHLSKFPGAVISPSSAKELAAIGVVKLRNGRKSSLNNPVYPRTTAIGELLTSEIVSAQPQNRVILLQCYLELKRVKASSIKYVDALCGWHKHCKAEGTDLRDMRKLLHTLKTMEVKPSLDSTHGFFGRREKDRRTEMKLRTYLGSGPSDEKNSACEWLQSVGGYGDLPVGPEYPERRKRLHSDAFSLFRRANVIGGNFWKLSGDTLTYPSERSGSNYGFDHGSLLSRFGEQSFSEFSLLHSSNPHHTPGAGLFFSNPRMPKLFHGMSERNRQWQGSEDRYHDAFPGMDGVLDNFKRLSIFLLRGGIGVQVSGKDFDIAFSPGGPTHHYSLYVVNDSFDGSFEKLFLIPSIRINAAIIGAKYSSRGAPSHETGDLADSILNGEKLGKIEDAPYIFSLSNITSQFSGLVAGAPRKSKPLFDHEIAEDSPNEWRDIRDRVHYEWLLRKAKLSKFNTSLDEESRLKLRNELLEPYEQTSLKIASVAHRLLNVLEVFLHRFSAYKSNLLPLQLPVAPLVSAFYGHHRRSQQEGSSESVPLLCRHDRSSLASSVEVVGDPADLTVMLDGTRYQLPKSYDLWDTAEHTIWRRAVGIASEHRARQENTITRYETEIDHSFIKREYL